MDIIIDIVLLAIALLAFAVLFVICAKEKWKREMDKVDAAIQHLNIKV